MLVEERARFSSPNPKDDLRILDHAELIQRKVTMRVLSAWLGLGIVTAYNGKYFFTLHQLIMI